MKIVFLDAFTTNPGDVSFSELANGNDFTAFDRTDESNFLERSIDADIIIVNKFLLSATRLQLLPKLKLVCVAATGYNNVDVEAAKKLKIKVCNVTNYSTQSVAQHIFAALLALNNKSDHYFSEVQNGRWSQSKDFCFFDNSIHQLNAQVLGIYGFGNIGAQVAGIGLAFGMKVLVSSRSTINSNAISQVSFDELLHQSDILSLHVSLNEETSECINSASLKKMKSAATLINTGRGPLINENDLASHLASHPNFRAVLDVLSSEPPPTNHPLVGLNNCFITPHIAWASKEAREELILQLCKNIDAFIHGIERNIIS